MMTPAVNVETTSRSFTFESIDALSSHFGAKVSVVVDSLQASSTPSTRQADAQCTVASSDDVNAIYAVSKVISTLIAANGSGK